jgi:hypothetical protein
MSKQRSAGRTARAPLFAHTYIYHPVFLKYGFVIVYFIFYDVRFYLFQ